MSNSQSPARGRQRLLKFTGYLLLMLLVVLAVDHWRNRQIISELSESAAVWRDIDGKVHDLKQLSAKQPIVVYWWASWCPVCQTVSPSVNSLAADVPIISIAIRSGSDAELRRYQQLNDYHYAVVNDQSGQLSARWGVSVTPTILIINNGNIVSATSGITTSAGLRLRLWIEQLFSD